jgi:fibronectin type 3 domain-containing protein
VTLRWTQSTTPGVTQNYIYRRTNPGSYPSAPTVKISAATSYVNTKLNSGNTYCYQVTAVSNGVESPKSSEEACANAK